MKACITGGAGFIGRALVQHLKNEGVSLRLLSRRKCHSGNDDHYFIADLTDSAVSLNGFFDDVDVIYHCAGELKDKTVMRSLHVDGTAKLLQAAKNHIDTTNKPLHWVQLSSVGAYGSPKGKADRERVVVETTPAIPTGEYEITKTLADEMVIQFAKMEPLFTYTILRPSNVIGKNMTNQSVRSLINIIKKKHFFYIGSTHAIATYIHVDDVVDALALCGNDVQARGHIFNLSNDCMLSDIVIAVAKNAGITPPTLRIPKQPIRLLTKLFSLLGITSLTENRIDALIKRTRYPNQKLKEKLAFTPRRSIPHMMATFDD